MLYILVKHAFYIAVLSNTVVTNHWAFNHKYDEFALRCV